MKKIARIIVSVLHHYLEEQIAYISVQEEEERMREELQKGTDVR